MAYLPGFVGLNNLKCTDYVNVVLHALSHVKPIRDFFLNPVNYRHVKRDKAPLVYKFGEVLRKLWSKDNFKSVVAPQDFVQEVAVSSQNKFHIGKQAEAVELLVWLLNELHRGLGGSKKPNSSIIYRTFQGSLQLSKLTKTRRQLAQTDEDEEDEEQQDAPEPAAKDHSSGPVWTESVMQSPFLVLNLEIPSSPLFKDSQGGLVIPQVLPGGMFLNPGWSQRNQRILTR